MAKSYGTAFERAKEEYWMEHKGRICCLGEKLIPQVKCYGVMTIHHAKGKEGSLLTDKRYFKFLCRRHHDWVHRNHKEAVKLGLSFD